MAITNVKVIVTCPGRNYVFVKIETDSGVYGIGEATINGREQAVAQEMRHASELLIGMDEDRINDIWNLMQRWGYWRGGPVSRTAVGGIDIALWDIKGKKANMPVYQLLGGKARDGVMVYGHAHGETYEDVLESIQSFHERGYIAVRAQHGAYGGPGMLRFDPPHREGLPDWGIFEPAEYLTDTPKMFEFLRKKLGMEVELLHDVHEQLLPIEAAQLAKNLEPYRLFFLEDILRPEHLEGFKLVRDHSTTALAIGEIFADREQYLMLFQNQLIDFFRAPPMHFGGISESLKLAALAEPYQIRSAFHGAGDLGPVAQAASVTVGCVIPNFGVQEWTKYPEPAYDVIKGACEYRDGYAYPNDAPGLGLDLDEELAAKYPYKEAWMPLRRRRDGTMHVY